MILDITADDLEKLQDHEARELVARLCEADVRAKGFATSVVTWGGHPNAPDGGIDVRVSLPAGAQIAGYIARPCCGFQVKTQPMPPSEIAAEMAPGGVLRSSLVELAAAGGAYIIVCLECSVSDSVLRTRYDAMMKAAAATDLVVHFYDRTRLADWLNQHKGLVPWVRKRIGASLSGWRGFEDWSSSPTSLDQPYLIDDQRRLFNHREPTAHGFSALDGLIVLRQILAKGKGIVRLLGHSGVGKTRFVQALVDERLGDRALSPAAVLYTDASDEPTPDPQEMLARLIASRERVIMIIDDCGAGLHQKLVRRIENAERCELSLITIEHDISDDEPRSTDIFTLEPASTTLVERMLELRYPALSAPDRQNIATRSGGNARAALAHAEANAGKSGESLANLKDSEWISRLFNQGKGSSEALRRAAMVGALVYSFDGETLDGDEAELAPLAALAGMTVEQFFTQVAELQRRKLVQKREKWRAVLPQSFAEQFARQALMDVPFQRIEQLIVMRPSSRLLVSFSRRIGALHGDERVAAIAARWLDPDGLLKHPDRLSREGGSILRNIASIDPAQTLAYLERAAAEEGLLFFIFTNRQAELIIQIAFLIAFEARYFERCANLIQGFVLADRNGREHGKMAREYLAALFALRFSGTHASVAQRVGFIRKLSKRAGDVEAHLIAQLIDVMLQADSPRTHVPREFGARKRDHGFAPSEGEVTEWFAQTLRLVLDVGLSNSPAAEKVRRSFARRLETVSAFAPIDQVVSVAERFAASTHWPWGWVAVRAALRRSRRRPRPPLPIREGLKRLSKSLRSTGLAATIQAYVLCHGPEQHAIHARCEECGRQLGRNPAQLQLLLPEILLLDHERLFYVGRGVAATCQALLECWNTFTTCLLASKNEHRPYALHGFIEGTLARSRDAVDSILDGALADARLHRHFVSWQALAGIDERGYARLVEAIKLESVPASSLDCLRPVSLSDEQVVTLVETLLARSGAGDAAMRLLGSRMERQLGSSVAASEVLTRVGRSLLENVSLETLLPDSADFVGAIISRSLDGPQYESHARALCHAIKEHAPYRLRMGGLRPVIEALLRTFPATTLDELVADFGTFGHRLFRDARADSSTCVLECVPADVLLQWAALDPDSRYVQLAGVIRFFDGIFTDFNPDYSRIALHLIGLAPDPVRVLEVLRGRLDISDSTEHASVVFAAQLDLIESLQAHPRSEVAAWAAEHQPHYRERVARARRKATAGDWSFE